MSKKRGYEKTQEKIYGKKSYGGSQKDAEADGHAEKAEKDLDNSADGIKQEDKKRSTAENASEKKSGYPDPSEEDKGKPGTKTSEADKDGKTGSKVPIRTEKKSGSDSAAGPSGKNFLKRSVSLSLEREAQREREAALAGVNTYYIKISKYFRRAKTVSALLLAFFAVIMLASFRDDITPQNLQYMLRDLNITNTVYSNDSTFSVSYDTDTDSVFSLFRDQLAVASKSGFSLYSPSGSKVFDDPHNYKNPAVVSSDSCMIVYDLGGNYYSVYNSLEKLSEQSTAYPVAAAAVSDSGMYAILTRSAEYRSAIYVYDSHGVNIANIFKDKLVLGIGFAENGDDIIVASADSADGSIVGELTVHNTRSDAPLMSAALDGELPVLTRAYGSNVSVMTDRSLISYNRDGTQVSAYSYGGISPITGCIGNTYSALAFPSDTVNGQSDIRIVSGGELRMTVSADGDVKCLKEYGNTVYALCRDGILRIEPEKGNVYMFETEGNPCDINITANTLLVSYYSHTDSYYLSEIFTEKTILSQP